MFPAQKELTDTNTKGRVRARDNEISNLSIALLGKRVIKDQALIEYLIEFLLVFVSRKGADAMSTGFGEMSPETDGRMRFHTLEEVATGNLTFIAEPRVALRRFLFYENSKLSGHSRMDDLAFAWHKTLLRENDESGFDTDLQAEEDVALVHDLLCSYSAVTRNRGWVAKALLPVCPELVLPDLQGMTKRQKVKVPENLTEDPISGREENCSGFIRDLDWLFAFDQHNFLARGGQMLYLHVLHALLEREKEDPDVRKQLESGITNMLRQAGSGTGQLAAWVQDCWEQNIVENLTDGDREKEEAKSRFLRSYTMGYIANSFSIREQRFLDELLCFFRAEIHPVARIELLSQGMVFSLLRAMHVVAAKRCNRKKGAVTLFREPVWVVDVSGQKGTSNIARQAADSYQEAYHSFQTAMQMIARKRERNASEQFSDLKTGQECSSDVFKNLGKTMKFIIPPKGRYERFTLPETLVRYLVLALIPPGQVVTLDTFLDRLYSHFGIVIAPEQFRDAVNSGRLKADWSMADYFSENAAAFQVFLKRCGFLRDLSDATAIVENPYQEVKMD